MTVIINRLLGFARATQKKELALVRMSGHGRETQFS
jgi:hypothetical protein